MLEKVSFVLMIAYWVGAAMILVLRFGFPKAAFTRKFLEYVGHATVVDKEASTATTHNKAYRAVR